eukprot:1138339-Pelagomonas_calceolata.AAC.15
MPLLDLMHTLELYASACPWREHTLILVQQTHKSKLTLGMNKKLNVVAGGDVKKSTNVRLVAKRACKALWTTLEEPLVREVLSPTCLQSAMKADVMVPSRSMHAKRTALSGCCKVANTQGHMAQGSVLHPEHYIAKAVTSWASKCTKQHPEAV